MCIFVLVGQCIDIDAEFNSSIMALYEHAIYIFTPLIFWILRPDLFMRALCLVKVGTCIVFMSNI
jgi:hypothetical protein